MKKFFFLLVLFISLARLANAQSGPFSLDSIWAPPYICQANVFDVKVFGMAAMGTVQPGPQSYTFSNDTVYVQFHFVAGIGPAVPTPISRSINVPAPLQFGNYKIVAQAFYNGALHQTLTTSIAICSSVSGNTREAETTGQPLIFPNPTTGFLNIVLPAGSSTAAVSITDVTGRILYSGVNQPAGHLRLDLAALPAGLYLVRLKTEKGVFSCRLLKK